MNVAIAFQIAIEPRGAAHACVTCDARAASVCHAIPRADLARLASIALGCVAKPSTAFINEGDFASAFFNISHGTVRLYKLLPDGRRQITGFAGVGHFLGLAVTDSYAFSAEAIDTVRYCRYPRARWRALIDDFPEMGKCLLEFASNELIAAQEQMLLLGRKSARERLASFLLAQSGLGDAGQHPSLRFELPMNRGDIADYLGLTTESISRTLTKLRAEGMIEIINTSTVVIRNRPGLQRLADGTKPVHNHTELRETAEIAAAPGVVLARTDSAWADALL